jgi:MYXO-CTERM domain-containing protein
VRDLARSTQRLRESSLAAAFPRWNAVCCRLREEALEMHFHAPGAQAALIALGFAILAGTAAADILPPDACQNEGAVCDNAGLHGDQPGVCQKATCTRPEPKPDGGIISYDCLRCTPAASGGAAGTGGSTAGEAGHAGNPGTGGTAAGTGGAAAGNGGATTAPPASDDSGCNCRLTPATTERGLAALMLLAGYAAWRRARRSAR